MVDRSVQSDELFARALDGELDEALRAELSELLRRDVTARARFLQVCRIRIALGEALNIDSARQDTRVSPTRTAQATAATPTSTWRVPALVAAAALILVAVSVSIYALAAPDLPANPYADTPFATVIDTTGDLLVEDDFGVAGREYAAGQFDLAGGTADLLLDNRVSIDLRGRSKLTVHNPMSASLALGSATFDCPPGVTGYTVHLPGGARIVDLGTRFRVSVDDDGAARVEVLSGTVEVRRGDEEAILLTRSVSARVPGDASAGVEISRHPLVLSDAAIWLRADALGALSDGDPVAIWPGSTATDWAAESVKGAAPTFVHNGINGRRSVRFSGAQSMQLPTTSELGIINGDYEIYIVAKTDRADGQFLLAAGTPRGVARYEMHVNHPWLDVGYNFIPDPSAHVRHERKGAYVGKPHVFIARLIEGRAHACVDGLKGTSALVPADQPAMDVPLLLGVRSDGSFPFIGDIAEVLIFDRALDEDEQSQVLEYLQTRYGIGVQADQPPLIGDIK